MGHTIEYITVDKKTEILKTAQWFAWENVDHYENIEEFVSDCPLLETIKLPEMKV